MTVEVKALRKLFPSKHIPLIISLVYEAGRSLIKKTERDKEDWITRRLCNRIYRINEYRDSPLRVTTGAEILSSDIDEDAAAGRLDICITCGPEHEIYFVIEAKKLRVRNLNGTIRPGSSEYVDEGMTRFITGQYAPCMETSAMLGYVFDGDIFNARSGIDNAVQSNALKLKLMSPKQLIGSKIFPGNIVDVTCHDLDKRLFTMYHIFLAI